MNSEELKKSATAESEQGPSQFQQNPVDFKNLDPGYF
jgi:hypothetical protein